MVQLNLPINTQIHFWFLAHVSDHTSVASTIFNNERKSSSQSFGDASLQLILCLAFNFIPIDPF